MDPTQYIRLAIIVVIVLLFPLGYLKGCSDEKVRFDAYKEMVAAAGKAQEERTKERINKDRKTQQLVEMKHAEEVKERRARFDSIYRRYAELLNDPRGSIVPSAGSSTAKLMPEGVVCFRGAELDRAIREAEVRFSQGVVGLLFQGEDGLADRRWWGQWATGVGSCGNTFDTRTEPGGKVPPTSRSLDLR